MRKRSSVGIDFAVKGCYENLDGSYSRAAMTPDFDRDAAAR